MIQAIFFDQDNTIVNTSAIAKPAYKKAIRMVAHVTSLSFNELHVQWKKEVQKVKDSTDPQKRQFAYSFTKTLHHFSQDENLASKAVDIINKEIRQNIQLTSGTKEFFQRSLSCKKVLFTEDDRERVRIKLEKFNLFDAFDSIVTSSETSIMKPHISYFQTVWEKLKLDPSMCLYVGDNWEKDCKIGQEHGGTGVLFGKQDIRADYSIMNMMELLPIVSK